ncbi:hypothetical protein DFJ74DRAFT_703232 [Hyaloraphidium curvatum]|nr:hypothetical protein DFJ74DRAFT_703232 [Hyaloraphidium curvatum]
MSEKHNAVPPLLAEQLKNIPHHGPDEPMTPPQTPVAPRIAGEAPPPQERHEAQTPITNVAGTATAEPGAQKTEADIADDPKWTSFLLKDRSQVQSSYTTKPAGRGESIILRSPKTPPGTPLVVRPNEETRTCWDLFQQGKKRAGADSKCMGVRKPGSREYEWFSWADVERQIRALGEGMASSTGLEFGSGERVGVFMGTSMEFALVDGACNSRGWTVVPLYETFASDALIHIVKLVEMKVVFTTPRLLARLISIKPGLPNLTHVVVARADLPEDIPDLDPAQKAGFTVRTWREVVDDGARVMGTKADQQGSKWWWDVKDTDTQTICFTSGTTGMPKGAVISHGNWVCGAAGAAEVFEDFLSPGDTYISYLPMAHCFEKIDMYNTFNLGCVMGFFGGDVLKLFDDMEVLKPTYFPTVPRLLSRFHDVVMNQIHKSGYVANALWKVGYEFKRQLLYRFGIITKNTPFDKLLFGRIQAKMGGCLRGIVTGSAPIPPPVIEWYRIVMGCEVLEGYAQTENCAVSLITRPGDYTFPYGSFVGVPFQCNEIKLIDAPEMNYFVTDYPHPRGEICSRGAEVMQGYYKQPDKTAETVDKDGWLHSGDVGELLPNGTIKIIDRIKNVLKLAQGEYVAVERVENILSRSDFIMQIFLEGDSLKTYLVGIIHPDPDRVVAFAESHGKLKGLSYEQLCDTKDLHDAIMADIRKLAKENELHSFEIPKSLYLEPKPFSMENDLLTPTFKNKRPQLKKFYGGKIKALYAMLDGK